MLLHLKIKQTNPNIVTFIHSSLHSPISIRRCLSPFLLAPPLRNQHPTAPPSQALTAGPPPCCCTFCCWLSVAFCVLLLLHVLCSAMHSACASHFCAWVRSHREAAANAKSRSRFLLLAASFSPDREAMRSRRRRSWSHHQSVLGFGSDLHKVCPWF